MGRWSKFDTTEGRVEKRVATPTRAHSHDKGGDVFGHQTDDCAWCRKEVERWLRPQQTGQRRGWRHATTQSEYCYDGTFTDIIPEGS